MIYITTKDYDFRNTILKSSIILLLCQTHDLTLSTDQKVYAQDSNSKPKELPPNATIKPNATINSPIKTQWIKEIKTNQYEVHRSILNTHLSDPDQLNQLSRQFRIVPHFKDGKPIGFKVIKIADQCFLSALGFKNRDVVQSVNGISLASMNQAMEVFESIKIAKKLIIEMERDGKPFKLEYLMKD
jgi:general secretion pathway protein C